MRLQAEEGGTLSAVATSIRDDWLETLPSADWCQRYGGGWADVQQLMERSRSARHEDNRRRQELDEAKSREAEARARRAEEAQQAAARLAEAQERIAEEQRQRAEAEQQRAAEAEARAREAEAGRRRSKRLAMVAGLFALAAVGAAAAAVWFGIDADRNAALAERSAHLAQLQRDQAFRSEALFRAEQARRMLRQGLPVTAMQLALSGLPEDPGQPEARPWVAETGGALVEAMSAQRELNVLRRPRGSCPGGRVLARWRAHRERVF